MILERIASFRGLLRICFFLKKKKEFASLLFPKWCSICLASLIDVRLCVTFPSLM